MVQWKNGVSSDEVMVFAVSQVTSCSLFTADASC